MEGDPDPDDWDQYWAARLQALDAATELALIAPPEIVESASEAMDELLDISWDYEHNGPEFLKAALWNKIGFVDAQLEAVFRAGRAEFGQDTAIPRPGRWGRPRKQGRG